jgi:putative DNA primase/helicase
MTPLHERARGRWKAILPALGIDRAYLTGKNGPCPLCPGGRDRWRFDNKRGDGTWICSQCGAGQGVALALKFTRAPFKEVAQRIERIIGEAPVEQCPAEQSTASKRAALNRLWQSGRTVVHSDPVGLWITGRGIRLDAFPRALRTAPRARYSGPPVSWHPAMLAMVADPSGKPATIHKTYITADGKKAPVDKVRMFCAGTVPAGGAVRLAPPAEVLGVAEGIETAFACRMMFAIPTWSALNAGGLEKFEPPAETRRLIIFGDNDANGTGQRAAYALAARLSGRIVVDVRIPEQSDTDWNDVLLS